MMSGLLGQKPRAALAVLGTVLFLFVPPSAKAQEFEFFTGGGYGPTPETAVQAAIWDAETTASSYMLYTCEVVGEPEVFPRSDDIRGNYYGAQATVHCTP
jgi:hypothetical protein